jgi:HAD superfamily hydrolase (TIGR01509 family)
MIKAIIFDCFGVVIADGLEAVVVEQEKTDPSFRAFVHDVIGQSNRGETKPSDSHRRIGDRLGVTPENLQQKIYGGEARNQRVIDLIGELRAKYKTALLSNVGKNSLHHRFSDDELSKLFDVVVVSGEVGFAKPDREIYHHTANLLGVEPAECVFIDDRQAYVSGAEQAGMQAILYQDFEQMKTELEKILVNPKG